MTADLTSAEAQALEFANGLDSGEISERLAVMAHVAAYQTNATPGELRQLAALALVLARRLDAAEDD